ncbi:MAG: electron transporter RnfE [Ignavibacteriae bacterium]|jgi:putative membrane protein|nr:electron transporter RnfE [Ignavibacteriota bacterium]MBZ0179107.1 SHOCT domain-containing protein [Melioribacteraceae bacterium]MDD3558278.1 SHOCT domain-containing protein [Melioribacteraceae bacterium]GJQ64400.1 MAG: hypothetical protein SCALA702_34530 [Melioribacteraceae bacterium]
MMGGGIIGIILIALVIWGIFQFTGRDGMNNLFRNNRAGNSADEEDPLEILKKRYAKGEINTEEYERMKKELR